MLIMVSDQLGMSHVMEEGSMPEEEDLGSHSLPFDQPLGHIELVHFHLTNPWAILN